MLAIRRRGRPDNFGIQRVERLAGNVGYLDIRRVAVPEFAGPAISAAMELVAGSYALIIDLRRNGGGSPDGVVFWCSHLLRDAKTHLNDIFDADTGETTGGGAHPTRGYPVSDAIHIGIPHTRSINPVTGTNWEGTGVVPDVAVRRSRRATSPTAGRCSTC